VVGQKGAESRLKAVSAIAETLHAKDVANQARVKELEAELATARAAVEVAQNGAREAGKRAEKAEAERDRGRDALRAAADRVRLLEERDRVRRERIKPLADAAFDALVGIRDGICDATPEIPF
jgi:chromosome segregation ATPase